MKFRNFLALALFGSALVHGFGPLSAQEAEEERDWLENYYIEPDPDGFVEQMKNWAEEGVLDNELTKPTLIAFISQIIRQNRDRLDGWYDGLAGLTPEQMQVMHTAMLFSRTREADEIMTKVFGNKYTEQKLETQKILEMPLDKKQTPDMLWGFFFATGSEQAIRRIVLCFRFLDADERPPGVDIPEGYAPHYKQLPSFAFGSLVGNAERHPRILEILTDLYENGKDLVPHEKNGIYDVLSEFYPEKYPPIDRSGKSV